MVKDYNILMGEYFKKHSFAESNIQSFNNFINKEMQQIVNEIGDIVPTVTPPEIEDFKIKLDKIWVEKPQLVEADGSKRNIFPIEARLRKITYSVPIYLNVSTYVSGIQRESFTTQIGKLPLMLKSKNCHLHGLKREELIQQGEDPDDPGGYFILNGNERVLVNVEDLASNRIFIEKNVTGPSRYVGKIFSEKGPYRIPHLIEQMKDGIIYLSFTRFKRIPIIIVIKALGLTKDQEITNFISSEDQDEDIFFNLFEHIHIKTQDEALEFLAKKAGITQPKEQKLDRVNSDIDKYLLPHVGILPEDRLFKAYNLCKMIKKFLNVSKERVPVEDKDHYMNKRLKLSGDLLADLFRINLKVLINDILYNFQRLIKRGKFHSVKIVIRDKLLTSRIKTAIATGSWVGGRKGISQNIDRTNFLATLSHLQRVVSLLSASQENFKARALHGTHWGRLCPIETPEGVSIGLRKNLSLLCKISQEDLSEEKMKKILEANGLILNKK